METRIVEIAERIAALRDIMEITPEQMAEATDVSVEEYLSMEKGEADFSFTFLYKCANRFGVDIVELLTGDMPKLSFYTVVRNGEGLPIKRRSGFNYQHMAPLFKNKQAEPFIVTAPYSEDDQNKEIKLSYHKGQEFDYIIEGSLKVAMEDHIEVLNAGDAIYYDSGHGHGMIATGGKPCKFLAVVLKDNGSEENK